MTCSLLSLSGNCVFPRLASGGWPPIASNSNHTRPSCYGRCLPPLKLNNGQWPCSFPGSNDFIRCQSWSTRRQRQLYRRLLATAAPTRPALTGTWTRPQHWSTHSYRRMSTIAALCWKVHQKWSMTGCNGYWMLLLVWSPVVTSTTSRLLHSELHWLDVPERVQYQLGIVMYSCLHCQSPWYLTYFFVQVPDFSATFSIHYWEFFVGSPNSAHGPSLWPARRFGALCQTARKTRILAGTNSDVCWIRIYLHCTEASSVLKMIRSMIHYTKCLNYLIT